MTDTSANNPNFLRRPRRWLQLLVMLLIFLCGGIIGAVAGAKLQHQHMVEILKHEDPLAEYVLPGLHSKLDLTEDQTRKVERIIRRRQAAMQTIQAECHPLLVAELQTMRKEVAAVLSQNQQQRWTSLCDTVEERFLPVRPGPPPANLLFDNFDANDDGALTKEEVFFGMWLRLQRADADGDGKVTQKEYKAALP